MYSIEVRFFIEIVFEIRELEFRILLLFKGRVEGVKFRIYLR